MAGDDPYSYDDTDTDASDVDIDGDDDDGASGYSPGVNSPSSGDRPADSHFSHSPYRDSLSTPPSRQTSTRSSPQASTPTTFVSSKKDRVRYSWQSIHEDEPNRPRIHIVKIVSNTATASAGFPQGEALTFSISPGGKRIAAYNSARLFVFQTAALPVNVSHEYALRHRPVAVEICDDVNILAVLADEHTVNIYDLSHNRACRIRTVRTDLPTTTIALSSTGGLLAAAYEGGVEVFSLAPNALQTDRRAVRSPKMDKLVFSQDDSTLLGTTTRIFCSSTVVISVPVFPSTATGYPSHQELKEAWCSGMLEPQNIRNSSHATFMREDGVMTNDQVFAWNGLEDTFGLLNTSDVAYSQVDFPVAISPPLSTCGGLGAAIHHTPSIDEHGNTAAMIVNDRTVRLYIVPQDTGDDDTKVEAHSIDHELDEEYGCPFTDLRWVHSRLSLPAPVYSQHQIRGRLVVTSPGGFSSSDPAEQSVQDIEGGRIILFDFDPQFAGQPGQTFVFNLGKAPPLTLEEERMDVAEEVALVRRRTVTSQRSNTLGKKTPSLGRAATTISRRQAEVPVPHRSSSLSGSIQQQQYEQQQQQSPSQSPAPQWRNRRSTAPLISLSADASRSLPDLLETSELNGEQFEEPYTQGAPRSVMSLQRAATAANAHRFQTLVEEDAETLHPGELPLPAYTEVPNQPLPGRYRALAGLEIPSSGRVPLEDRSPVSAIATAPPTFSGHQFPTTSTLSPTYANPNCPDRSENGSISPVTTAPSTITSDNASPTLSRTPTRLTLRTQPSWETVNTTTQTSTQPPSTLRSQLSWESAGTTNYFSPALTGGSRTAPTSPESDRPNQQVVYGLGLHDFRHSMLLPRDPIERPSTEPQARGYMHRPPHVNAFHTVSRAATSNLRPSNRLEERRSGSSAGGASFVSALSREGVAAGRSYSAGANATARSSNGWNPHAPPSPLDSRPSLSVRSQTDGTLSHAGSSTLSLQPSSLSGGRTGERPFGATRPTVSTHGSRGAGTGRKAWFAKKREYDDVLGAPALPRVGAGVREDLMTYEAQGKKCVVM